MAFDRFGFTRDWTKPSDFPTYEDSEEKVRADLQFQPDEIKAFLNAFLSTLEADGIEHIKVRDPETDIEEWVSLKAYLDTLSTLAASVNDATKQAMSEQATTFTQALQLLKKDVNDTVDGLVKNVTVDIDSGSMIVSFQNGNEVTYALPKGGASGAGGHVGPEPPEDESITIWIDTDEEEDENWPTTAKVREIVEGYGFYGPDNPAPSQMDLLWENASPSSAFVAQTVSVPNLSLYKYFMIYVMNGDGSETFCFIYPTEMANKSRLSFAYYSGGVKAQNRGLQATNNTIVFENAVISGTATNEELIPVAIYGIK